MAQLVSEERERQRNSEMREEFARLAGTVQTVSEKINNNQSQMKEIGEKIDSLVSSTFNIQMMVINDEAIKTQ